MTVEKNNVLQSPRDSIARAKAEMRRAIAARAPSEKELAAESRALCAALEAWPMLRKAQTVAAFMPTEEEVRITSLLSLLLCQGKRVVFPRCEAKGELVFCPVISLNQLARGKYGILAPMDDAPSLPLDAIDVMLVPLAAADRAGGRLGKGGGYYDRVLRDFRGTACGLVLDHQWVENVPMDEHDVRLSWLCDASGVHAACQI